MKERKGLFIMLVSLLCFPEMSFAFESQNQEAASPFKKGMEAKYSQSKIDSQMQADAGHITFQPLFDQAQKYESIGNLELAATIYEALIQKAPERKDIAQRLTDIRNTLKNKQVQEILESEYAIGLEALKKKEWVRALFAFEKVLELDLNYLDARRKWREAQRGLNRESNESVISRYYAEGLMAMKNNNYSAAYSAFEKVSKSDAKYRNVVSLLEEAEIKLAEMEAAAIEKRKRTQIDSLHQMADVAMQEEDWVQVVVSLGILRTLVPDDEKVHERLLQAQANLKKNGSMDDEEKEAQGMEYYLTFGGFAFALLLFPVVGLFLFSPMARARVYLLRGNYAAAAMIYEKMIARNPGKVKLYPTLANIYMLSGRQDDNAIRVFKTVLQLNLPVQDRERIHSLLAQRYVTGEITDGDAIDVLERELQKEVAKKRLN
ncbi:MAG: tetratricopeptide repeat protein [bacterium]